VQNIVVRSGRIRIAWEPALIAYQRPLVSKLNRPVIGFNPYTKTDTGCAYGFDQKDSATVNRVDTSAPPPQTNHHVILVYIKIIWCSCIDPRNLFGNSRIGNVKDRKTQHVFHIKTISPNIQSDAKIDLYLIGCNVSPLKVWNVIDTQAWTVSWNCIPICYIADVTNYAYLLSPIRRIESANPKRAGRISNVHELHTGITCGNKCNCILVDKDIKCRVLKRAERFRHAPDSNVKYLQPIVRCSQE